MNELLQHISSHYKFGDCIIRDKPSYWGAHIRWHVQTARRGDIFIKESPPFLNDAEFYFHIRYLLFAQKAHRFVVPIICDTNANPVYRWNNRLITIYPWIQSRSASFEIDADIEQVANLSASFLKNIRNWRSEEHEKSWNYPVRRSTFCPDRWDEIYHFTYLIDQVLRKYQLKATRKVQYLRNWIKKSERASKDLNVLGLVQQFIHGDMQRFNFLADEKNDFYLIDYDRLHWSYRLCDIANLAVLIGAIYSPENTTRIFVREEWEWEKVFVFANTFSLVDPLNYHEKKLIKEFLGLFLIRNFIGGFDLDYEENSLDDDFIEQLEKVIALLEQLNKWSY